jgi:hypothetical protein
MDTQPARRAFRAACCSLGASVAPSNRDTWQFRIAVRGRAESVA